MDTVEDSCVMAVDIRVIKTIRHRAFRDCRRIVTCRRYKDLGIGKWAAGQKGLEGRKTSPTIATCGSG